MSTTNRSYFRQAVIGVLMACAALTGTAVAQNVTDRPPSLKPLPASSLSLVADAAGGSTLRFSTTSWNNGTGALQLEAGPVDTGSGQQQVLQRVFLSDGTSYVRTAGYLE